MDSKFKNLTKGFEDYTVISISHIDLDGYTSQYLINKLVSATTDNQVEVNNFNIDYAEVNDFITKYLPDMITGFRNKGLSVMIYITDLNLTKDLIVYLDKIISNDENVRLLLLDHHSADFSIDIKNYPWYILDKTKSASLLVYDYFSVQDIVKEEMLDAYVNLVNVSDIFLKDDEEIFNRARLLNKTVAGFISSIAVKLDKGMSSYKLVNNYTRDCYFAFIDNFLKVCRSSVFYIETILKLRKDADIESVLKLRKDVDSEEWYKTILRFKMLFFSESLIWEIYTEAISDLFNNIIEEHSKSLDNAKSKELHEIGLALYKLNRNEGYYLYVDIFKTYYIMSYCTEIIKIKSKLGKDYNISFIKDIPFVSYSVSDGSKIYLEKTNTDVVFKLDKKTDTNLPTITGSLRSLNPEDAKLFSNDEYQKKPINVARLASLFGGGGHANASGFVSNTLVNDPKSINVMTDAMNAVIKILEEEDIFEPGKSSQYIIQ